MPGLPEGLSCLSRLTALTLQCCEFEGIPPVVLTMPELESLTMQFRQDYLSD